MCIYSELPTSWFNLQEFTCNIKSMQIICALNGTMAQKDDFVALDKMTWLIFLCMDAWPLILLLGCFAIQSVLHLLIIPLFGVIL